MKIVHFLYSSSEKVHGGEVSTLNFIDYLKDEHNIEVLLYEETEIVEILDDRGISYDSYHPKGELIGPSSDRFGDTGKIRKYLNYLSYNAGIFKYLSRNDFEIIHYNNIQGYCLTYLGAGLSSSTKILHIRTEPKNLTWYWLFALITTDKIICVSNEVYNSIKEKLPGFIKPRITSKMEVVYNGVRTSRTRNDSKSKDTDNDITLDEEPFSVGYIGSIDPRKNQLSFLKKVAEKSNSQENMEFHFLGHPKDDRYYRRCLQLIEDKNIGDICNFHGYQNNIDSWYESLDATVLTSKREGLPRAVLESMIHGTPVVTTRTTGVEEIISNGENGYIIEEIDEVVSTLNKLSKNPGTSSRMAKRARKRINQTFSVPVVSEDLNEIYLDLES